MAFIDGSALNVVLPSLQRDLAAEGIDLFWILNSYLLMLAALIIVGGSLGDKLGRVKIFKVGIIIFMVGSFFCGFAGDVFQMILFRSVQGIGGAMMIPGSLAIISSVFDASEKGKAIGTWSSTTTIVTICGPVLGGVLADAGLWRFIFFLNIPLGLLSLYALQFKVPESREEGSRYIDWFGGLTIATGLGLMTYGFLEMPEKGMTDLVVWTTLVVGVLLITVFIRHESRIEEPMVPLGLFNNSTFSGVNILSFFLYAGLGGIMLFLSLNIIQVQGYSQTQAGLTFLPFSLLMIVIGKMMGSLTDKYGARRFLIFGPLITAAGMFWLSIIGITTGPSAYWTTYFPGFIVFALGMSITVVPLTTAVMTSVDDNQSGIASGINNSVTRISGTFVNAILGAFAIILFSSQVEAQLIGLEISGENYAAVLQEAEKLGDASASFLPASLQDRVDSIFDRSFVHVYQQVGMLSAALAVISSVVAFFTVSKNR